jgi:hypothetical protein
MPWLCIAQGDRPQSTRRSASRMYVAEAAAYLVNHARPRRRCGNRQSRCPSGKQQRRETLCYWFIVELGGGGFEPSADPATTPFFGGRCEFRVNGSRLNAVAPHGIEPPSASPTMSLCKASSRPVRNCGSGSRSAAEQFDVRVVTVAAVHFLTGHLSHDTKVL